MGEEGSIEKKGLLRLSSGLGAGIKGFGKAVSLKPCSYLKYLFSLKLS